ncbi:MAG: DUF6452 family protein [Salinimicrobium sp.]
MKQFQKWFFLAGFLLLSLGCQKDDICPPGTETTPNLLIEFYDQEDPTRLKAVQNLVVIATGKEDTLLGPVTTNNISIPLRTAQNFTEYSFIANAGDEEENKDIVSFTYSPTPVYLNRACGYKIEYLNLDVALTEDSENWIISDIILQENVENEAEAHISFTH